MEFTNPETAAKYVLLNPVDQQIWIPECMPNGKCWEGYFKDMPPSAAEKYVELKGKWVERRSETADVKRETEDTGESFNNIITEP